MEIFKGLVVSKVIGSGHIYVIPRKEAVIIQKEIKSSQELPAEWQRFQNAIEAVKLDISAMAKTENESQAAIANTYMIMLSDTVFFDEIHKYCLKEQCNIEYAAQEKTKEMTAKLESSNDAYLKERAKDVNDIFYRVISKLLNKSQISFTNVPIQSIIVAQSLNPSDAMLLLKQNIAGLAVEEGGTNSHLAILARNFGIPAVFGLKDIDKTVKTGQAAIVDGVMGMLITEPNEKIAINYSKQLILQKQQEEALESYRNRKTVTKDGIAIQLNANIGNIDDARTALQEGAVGIGLFRTEFLFMQALREAESKNLPVEQALSEDAQYKVYKELLQIMGTRPVTIRTLDSGGDKIIQAKGFTSESEKNPLLGCRAIRFCLSHQDIFKTQLRALYRASSFGNLKIMIPLITDPEQLVQVQQLTESIKAELRDEGIPINENTQLGIMVETPSAAVLADFFAEYADFFSIGTNDLTQYTLSVDRENPSVASLFNELHPAVLRLIKYTVECGKKTSIQVSVCGEMAGNPECVLALIGLGIRSLSMAPKNISRVKELLSHFSIPEIKQMTESAMELHTAIEVKNFIANFARLG